MYYYMLLLPKELQFFTFGFSTQSAGEPNIGVHLTAHCFAFPSPDFPLCASTAGGVACEAGVLDGTAGWVPEVCPAAGSFRCSTTGGLASVAGWLDGTAGPWLPCG